MSADFIIFWGYVVWVLVATFVFWRYFPKALGMARVRDFSETFYLSAGIACVSFGSGLNRAYWVVWRAFRDGGDLATAQWMADNAAFLGLLMVFIIGGYLMHVRAAYGMTFTSVFFLFTLSFGALVATAVMG